MSKRFEMPHIIDIICVKLLLDFRSNLRWRWLRASRLCPSPTQFKLHRSSAPPPPPPPLPPRRSPFALPRSWCRVPSPPAPSSQGALHFRGACRAMAASWVRAAEMEHSSPCERKQGSRRRCWLWTLTAGVTPSLASGLPRTWWLLVTPSLLWPWARSRPIKWRSNLSLALV